MDFEVRSLLYDLERDGVSKIRLEALASKIEEEIRRRVASIVSEAVQEAVSIGEDMKADEFLEQIRLEPSGFYVEITTDSGTTDFSTPPFPMLDSLLKNAKHTKTGDRYKVIPVGKKSNRPPKMLKGVENGLNRLNEGLKGKSLNDMALETAAVFNMGASELVAKKQEQEVYKQTEFRTVTSKQDPHTSWVQPAKMADMSAPLADINAKLYFKLSSVVKEVIHDMEDEINAVRDG